MRFRARKTFRLGPLRATVNQDGRWSFAITVGPVTHNLTRRTTSIDTPGPGGFHHQHRRRTRRDGGSGERRGPGTAGGVARPRRPRLGAVPGPTEP